MPLYKFLSSYLILFPKCSSATRKILRQTEWKMCCETNQFPASHRGESWLVDTNEDGPIGVGEASRVQTVLAFYQPAREWRIHASSAHTWWYPRNSWGQKSPYNCDIRYSDAIISPCLIKLLERFIFNHKMPCNRRKCSILYLFICFISV